MLEKNTQGEVWVFAEQEDGRLSEVSLELLSKGRELAEQLGVKLASFLFGQGVSSLTKTLIANGADKVYLSEDPLLENYQANPYAKIIARLVHEHRPQIVLFGATGIGRDLAPRVASTLRCGLTADCTDLEIGDHEETTKGIVHKNLLLQIRPAFGGNIIATIVNPDRWPQMATVREGVMRMPDADSSRKGEVVPVPARVTVEDLSLKLLDRFRAEKHVNLKAARVIVSGGAGVGSKENFRLIYDLANVLGGVVGGSRAAVDSGYVHKDHQVGQTGTTVRPALYIACGISGAVQHRAGMGESKKIVAINKDPQAPIFGIAHYALVGDLNVIIPRMIRAIRNRG
jgi:electron transfer flavoprotein alpha subunit